MKMKILPVFLCIFALVVLTSCFDSVQSISYDKGKYYWYMKFTVSKDLMELSGEDTGSFFKDIDENNISKLPDSVTIKPVDTEFELGMEISAYLDPKTKNEDEKILLPTKAGNEYRILFFAGCSDFFNSSDFSDSSEREMAQMMLLFAKFRVMVGKNIIPHAEGAYFAARDNSWYGEDYKMPVYDYGNCYCVEVPCSVLFESEQYDVSRIVFVKNIGL